MKNKVLRAISCVLLSAMLAVEVALPTQAAISACQHVIKNGTTHISKYLNADYICHQVEARVEGPCIKCGQYGAVVSIYTEPHSPGANGVCPCGYEPH